MDATGSTAPATPGGPVVDTSGMASTSSEGPAVEGRPPSDEPGQGSRTGWRRWTLVLLIRAAHPRLGLVSALGLAAAAALSGRPTREVGMVLATALVGQAILGWHNDVVDRRRDAEHERVDKPIGQGLLSPGDAVFAMACANPSYSLTSVIVSDL